MYYIIFNNLFNTTYIIRRTFSCSNTIVSYSFKSKSVLIIFYLIIFSGEGESM